MVQPPTRQTALGLTATGVVLKILAGASKNLKLFGVFSLKVHSE